MHAIYLPTLTPGTDRITVEGDEARHAARARRLRQGQPVIVLDGRGTVARCSILRAARTLELKVESESRVEPVRPAVHVLAAPPKGQRIERLIDALVQVGAASFTPITTRLSVVDPGEGKLARIQRIAVEAAKQSRRPWLMTLGEKTTFPEALGHAINPVIADAGGEHYTPSGADVVTLLVGPEGGWTDDELRAARSAGAPVASFGPHTMRIEVAAPTAAACILAAERSAKPADA